MAGSSTIGWLWGQLLEIRPEGFALERRHGASGGQGVRHGLAQRAPILALASRESGLEVGEGPTGEPALVLSEVGRGRPVGRTEGHGATGEVLAMTAFA